MSRRQMGHNYPQMGHNHPQMGSFLSDLIGIDLDLSKSGQALITGGTQGAQQEIAAQIVGNQQLQNLAYQASEKTLVDKVSHWIVTNKKMIAVGLVGLGGLFVFNKVFRK